MEITQFLVDTQSDDARIRNGAETSLRQFQEQHLPQFLLSLSFELANDNNSVESRRLAGILLKNSLPTQWIALDDTMIKSKIKDLLLAALASSASEARKLAAQVIAKVASLEIPLKQCSQLVKSLLSNIEDKQAGPASLKVATMETLGYICEEIYHEDLVYNEVRYFILAVVRSTRPTSETGTQIHLAAIKALLNALDAAKANFEDELAKGFIMKSVFNSALSPDVMIREVAFKCLVSVASRYHKELGAYMEVIITLTCDAISGDEESVALLAIEVWSSICVIELELQEAANPEDMWYIPHSSFVEVALPCLVPVLLERLLKQQKDPDQDDDVWNISKAIGACLGLVAKTVGVDIVPFVISFLEAKISDKNATYNFGSILDVPAFVKLAVLRFLLKDESKHAGDTLSHIFDFLYGPNFYRFVAVLLKGINDEVPNVVEKICGAIYKLKGVGASLSLLLPYPTEIIQHLIAAAELKDEEASKIRAAAAYDILKVVVRCANVAQASNIIANLLSEIIQEMDHIMHVPVVSMDNREKLAKLMASICVVLQVLIQKLSGTDN